MYYTNLKSRTHQNSTTAYWQLELEALSSESIPDQSIFMVEKKKNEKIKNLE